MQLQGSAEYDVAKPIDAEEIVRLLAKVFTWETEGMRQNAARGGGATWNFPAELR